MIAAAQRAKVTAEVRQRVKTVCGIFSHLTLWIKDKLCRFFNQLCVTVHAGKTLGLWKLNWQSFAGLWAGRAQSVHSGRGGRSGAVLHFSKRKCLISEEKLIFSVCLVSLPAEKEQEPKLTCEYCGWVDFAYTFKGSKRFCSMVCAKRQVTSSFILLLICL